MKSFFKLGVIVSFSILSLTTLLNAQDLVMVKRVTDGDTLVLTNDERVRLIGIDAPESRPNPRAKKQAEKEGQDLKIIIGMGKEATAFVKTLVKPGDEVKLEFDVEKRTGTEGFWLMSIFPMDGCSMRR